MTKSVIVGLTGNMGAGKSTAVKMIREMIIPVFEADQAVHILMRDNREMKALFYRKFPESVVNDEIDRSILSVLIKEGKLDVRQLEKMIYPFLEKELRNFFMRHRSERLVVLDVPLLFEAGWDKFCDKIIVVSAPAEVLKRRVFERSGMTEEKYQALTARQISDEEKRKKADYVIETQYGIEPVRRQLTEIMEEIE
ncbi:MAG: dephospho-CoA kinase [Alphaproteobacteria bacterium]|nr:dephospho-CoA kinase [Alphaproteobacteria bacterium]